MPTAGLGSTKFSTCTATTYPSTKESTKGGGGAKRRLLRGHGRPSEQNFKIRSLIFSIIQFEIRNRAPGRGYPRFPCGKFKDEDQRGSVPSGFPYGRSLIVRGNPILFGWPFADLGNPES